MKKFIPDAGEIVWVNFNPTEGREQKGSRPAVVISPKEYNAPSELMIVCPMTSQQKNYPFEVPVEGSVVLADQVRSVSVDRLIPKEIMKVPAEVLDEIRNKIAKILVIEQI